MTLCRLTRQSSSNIYSEIISFHVHLVEWLALLTMDRATGVRYPGLAGHIVFRKRLKTVGVVLEHEVQLITLLSVRARVIMCLEGGMTCQCDCNNVVKDTV